MSFARNEVHELGEFLRGTTRLVITEFVVDGRVMRFEPPLQIATRGTEATQTAFTQDGETGIVYDEDELTKLGDGHQQSGVTRVVGVLAVEGGLGELGTTRPLDPEQFDGDAVVDETIELLSGHHFEGAHTRAKVARDPLDIWPQDDWRQV